MLMLFMCVFIFAGVVAYVLGALLDQGAPTARGRKVSRALDYFAIASPFLGVLAFALVYAGY
jgi:hypothetical protein